MHPTGSPRPTSPARSSNMPELASTRGFPYSGLTMSSPTWSSDMAAAVRYETRAAAPRRGPRHRRARAAVARAEARACRLPTAAHQVNRDWFWIGAELALVLPKVHPKVVRRWRQRVGWAVYHAEWELDRLRQLVATILAHEPETDAWLRRRLGDLNGFHA
jgi:hypothetical protein